MYLADKMMSATTVAVWDDGMMHCDGPHAVAQRAVLAVLDVLARDDFGRQFPRDYLEDISDQVKELYG